ncbi:MAG: carboxylesterase/lipase family protein [Faecousia sp.]
MPIDIVKTSGGLARGVRGEGKYQTLTYFRGIPYAAPPVGQLRWAEPQDPEPWEGVRLFDQNGPTAYQNWVFPNLPGPNINDYDFYFDGYPEMSEDCLYLNICTGAQSPGEKRPVYMWFHGGGLGQGYAYEPEFDPSEFARKGIVVVQVGQRLNVFGYLSLPQISAEQEGKSGNYGLMDQVKALDWVRENIAAFGGDPENITVGGESGGSWKVCALAVCPAAKGKIRRVIGESWIMWFLRYHSMEEAEKIGADYFAAIGIDPNTPLEELRKMPAEKILPPGIDRHVVPGDMTYDGTWIPCPIQAEAYEQFGGGIDFLGGCNFGDWEHEVWNKPSEEGTLYFVAHHSDDKAMIPHEKINTAAKFYAHFKALLGDLYEEYDFPNLVPVTDDTAWYMTRRLAALGISPPGRACLSRTLMIHRLFGRYIGRKYPGTKAYAYLFSQNQPHLLGVDDPGMDPDNLLAWHGSELYYAFNSLRPGIPPKRPWRGVDYYVAEVMNSYWANFIKTGDPNGTGLPYWPSASEHLGYMELNAVMHAGEARESKLDELMEAYCRRVYQLDR